MGGNLNSVNETTHCLECGLSMLKKHVNHIYCSDACRKRHNRKTEKFARRAKGEISSLELVDEIITDNDDGWTVSFVVNDTQWPYIDFGLWEVVCEIASKVQPNVVVAAGDMLDFEQLSTFDVNPFSVSSVAHDVESFHKDAMTPLLDAAQPTHVVWLDGNHEDRIKRCLTKRAPALADSVSARKLMQLPDGWTYVPYGRMIGYQPCASLMIAHGWTVLSHSGATARRHVEDAGMSVMHGHTHRVGYYARTVLGQTVVGVEMGHMCNPYACPGAHKAGRPNWQQVAGHIVTSSEALNSFSIEPIIVSGTPDRRYVIWRDDMYRIGDVRG